MGIRLGAAAGWPGLVLCWWLVVADGNAPTASMVAVPVVVAAVTVALTAWWIRHNRAIYRRKGPRRAVPYSPTPYFRDRRSRALSYDPTAVRAAREVTVRVTADGVKRYEVVA